MCSTVILSFVFLLFFVFSPFDGSVINQIQHAMSKRFKGFLSTDHGDEIVTSNMIDFFETRKR